MSAELAVKEEQLTAQNQSGVDVIGLGLEYESARRRVAAISKEIEEIDNDILAAEQALVKDRELVRFLLLIGIIGNLFVVNI